MNETHANGFLTFFTTLLFALFASQPVLAATLCDELGALRAAITPEKFDVLWALADTPKSASGRRLGEARLNQA